MRSYSVIEKPPLWPFRSRWGWSASRADVTQLNKMGAARGLFLRFKPDANETPDFIRSTAVAALGINARKLVRFNPKMNRNRPV